MGLKEPDAGSDLGGLSTRGDQHGDRFVATGQKVFTTGADSADFLFAFVRTDPESRAAHDLSVLLAPSDPKGGTIRLLMKLGSQSTHTCEVFLDAVEVSADQLVSSLLGGARIVFGLLDAERIYVGAKGFGVGTGTLDLALRHARERVQCGVPIIEHQAVGHMLADMAIDVEMARLLVWRAATGCRTASRARSTGRWRRSRILKRTLAAQQRGMQICDFSYMVEYGMERYWRESKLNEIAGGTKQIKPQHHREATRRWGAEPAAHPGEEPHVTTDADPPAAVGAVRPGSPGELESLGAVFDHPAVAARCIRDLLPIHHELLGGSLLKGGDNVRVGYRAMQLAFAVGTRIELV